MKFTCSLLPADALHATNANCDGLSGKDLVEITRLLSAHRSCFVGHQAYSVLNTGRFLYRTGVSASQ